MRENDWRMGMRLRTRLWEAIFFLSLSSPALCVASSPSSTHTNLDNSRATVEKMNPTSGRILFESLTILIISETKSTK